MPERTDAEWEEWEDEAVDDVAAAAAAAAAAEEDAGMDTSVSGGNARRSCTGGEYSEGTGRAYMKRATRAMRSVEDREHCEEQWCAELRRRDGGEPPSCSARFAGKCACAGEYERVAHAGECTSE
jgi:hypothetical protein